jgi:cytochrome c553
MKKRLGLLFVALLPASVFAAEDVLPPDWAYWAYMVAPPGTDARLADPTVFTREGSNLALTQAVIQAPFTPPDWYPNEHPPLPDVVEHGRRPDVQPCMRCHLPNGGGHPESAYIAGLPSGYIVQQMRDFASGARHGLGRGNAARSSAMTTIAGAASDEEVMAAAEYYSSIPPVKWTRVVETAMVPETYLPEGTVMRYPVPGGGMEPIGPRVVEVPENSVGASIRDAHTSFIAYVPPGSIERGRELATTGGGGKTVQCAICHGEGLLGIGNVPPIAGRSPAYMIRQLVDIKTGVRNGPSAALMRNVVENLEQEDMINLVAYAASLDPRD